MTIYINGVQDATTTSVPSTIKNSSANLEIASENGGGTNRMAGNIDQVLVYNYARTPAQIAWDYNRGAAVAWYKMDECSGTTLNDASGNGFNATLTIGATTPQTAVGSCTDGLSSSAWYNGASGKYNSSINLDGADDYAATANNAFIAANGLTYNNVSYGGWFNPATTVASKTLLHKNNEFRLITDSSGYPRCELYNSGAWDTANAATKTTALTLGAWQQVYCVYNAGLGSNNLKLYINGLLVGQANKTNAITSLSSTPLSIGRNPIPSGYYNGKIDDAHIYNYALTPQQLLLLYNEGSAVRFAPLTGAP
jgi:hypothetical protein